MSRHKNLGHNPPVAGKETLDSLFPEKNSVLMTTKVTILGSGAMATACAILLAQRSQTHVWIWGRDADAIREMQTTRENRRLLPGISIPDNIRLTAQLPEALEGADVLVAAIPTQYLRASLTPMRPLLQREVPVVSVAKGIENGTFLRPTQIIAEVLGCPTVAALSGPSHAEEIGRGQPAIVVAASADEAFAQQVQELFNTDRFRVYTNSDLVGVELAGALKNVMALAAGISDGLGYGDNAKSALMTRGLVEMTRFGLRFGAESGTFSGLAGMGDLITTCVSPFGRNRKVGERLGRGETLTEILKTMAAVAEGVATTRSVHGIALRDDIDMPITQEVYQVLFEEKSPAAATQSLMLRPLKAE